jgi:hypothetical protein
MPYNVTFYDIASHTIKIHKIIDESLEELKTGGWSCDCQRSMLGWPNPDIRQKQFTCVCVKFLVLEVRDMDDNLIGCPDDYNKEYDDTARAIARRMSKEFATPTRTPSRDQKIDKVLASIGADAEKMVDGWKLGSADPMTPFRTYIRRTVEEPKVETEKTVPVLEDVDEYIKGCELSAIKKILIQWDPEKLITPNFVPTHYDGYAETFMLWVSRCNTADELAIQIAARFNHMTCLNLKDNGMFEIVKEQTYTAERCLPIAVRIRKVCGKTYYGPPAAPIAMPTVHSDLPPPPWDKLPWMRGRAAAVLWKG